MLARITPSQNLARSYFDPIDRIFDDVLSTWSIFDRVPHSLNQSYSFEEIDGKLKCEIELPGLKPGDVNINVERDYVTIAGTSRKNKQFKYQLSIPDGYEPESAVAKMEAGVLTLTFSPKDRPQSKRIEINVVNNE
jgi:HSP20 family molecular chaperone IbpA